jgi:hypothetical protein
VKKMAGNRNRKRLVPGVEQALEKFKNEIASELGIVDGQPGSTLEAALEKYKNEIASELGIASQVAEKGWENISSRTCGAVGGRMGGRIGGNMVKKMISMAEKELNP